ncbi:MAG: malto-oligosyltrehalose synthase [Desulfobacterales bacterium]
MNPPIATYRIQFNKDFGFEQAAEQVSYLKELGISHLYASPCLEAVSGSGHGYDVVNFSRVNPELGGRAQWERLCGELKKAGMGLILDIVPNHMAAHSRQNSMWRDVLAFGGVSPYAGFFDIDWETPDAKTRHKILLPILGDHYDTCLNEGLLQFKRRDSEIVLAYYEHDLPLSAQTKNRLHASAVRQNRSKEGADRNIGETPEPMDELLHAINRNPDHIHELLEQQHYVPAFWRTAAHDINYRRFFDINDLIGIRMEKEAVFNKSHRLILKWYTCGMIDGFRIDHPDGLSDPEEYLNRLAACAPNAWVVVEKILSENERLPDKWPVNGTTGYDFIHHVNGLFVDPDGEKPLSRLYEAFTGESVDYTAVVREKKRLVLQKRFSGDVASLSRRLTAIRCRHRQFRDLVFSDLHDALQEIIACFPVYRTYCRPALGEISPDDVRWIETAVSRAREHQPRIDPATWEFIEKLLMLDLKGPCEADFVTRFQQLTGPAMAKGVEDTTFYCYNRLVSLNEVGGYPGVFGTAVDEFHDFCRYIQAQFPKGLSTTATHDTKRGEDTRLRINMLSEIPEKWSDAVLRWHDMTTGYDSDQRVDANTLYFLFQTLVGTWPIELERITAYMQKAVREAKVHTSWTEIDDNYESALLAFIRQILQDKDFTDDLEAFVSGLLKTARIGSLSQILIKCTAPGVPDIYQGTELWDLSLVDPDNRRPVDYGRLRRLLSEIDHVPSADILSGFETGLVKQYVLRSALAVRRSLPACFNEEGDYHPLRATGGKAGHVVAFIRGGCCITIVPRLLFGLNGDWDTTVIDLPQGTWKDVFTQQNYSGGENRLSDMTARFPVMLLVRHQALP